MRLLKSCILSFSMYSAIPMPQINCDEEDGKYTMMFFPWIGAIIFGLEMGWYALSEYFDIPKMAVVFVLAALPLIVTGGFHMDGFMDTSDARSSYQPRERKLEILKDSHIGAFAVIRVITCMLIYLAALTMIVTVQSFELMLMLGCGFILSRIMSGIGVVTLKNARKEGMLFYTARTSQRRGNIIVLLLYFIAMGVWMVCYSWLAGLVTLIVTLLCYVYYRIMSYHVFGGITGDLAGWFVTFTEGAIAVALAVVSLWI